MRDFMTKSLLARFKHLAVVIAVQLVLIVLLFEIGLRIAQPFFDGLRALLYLPNVLTEYDNIQETRELLNKSVLGFHPGKNWEGFLLNSRGFRTPEYTDVRSPDVLRVVVLGDSFAIDSGNLPWRSMWPTLLQERLQTLLGKKVEVINLGVPAVGPRFLLRLWELEGRRLNPDLVILSFFIGNDFTDEFHEPLKINDSGTLARASFVFRLARNGRRLWQEQSLLRIPRQQAAIAGTTGMGVEVGEQHESIDPTFSGTGFFQIEHARLKICEAKSDYFDKRFAAMSPILKRFNASVHLGGAQFVLLAIPDEFQVNGSLLASLAPYSPEIDLEMPQRRLGDFLKQEQIPELDLLHVMQDLSKQHALYRERDTHWNRDGNIVAAEELAQFLVSTHLAH